MEETKKNNEIKLYIDELRSKSELIYDIEEEVIVELLEIWKYIMIYLTVFLLFISLCIYTFFNYDDSNALELFMKKMFIYGSIVSLSWLNGKFLRGKLQLKVNYTRKVSHVFVWLIPFIADVLINVDETFVSQLWNIFMGVFGQVLWMIPTRTMDRTGFLNTAFSAIDRPEDRPNTLKWLSLQNLGTGLSILPFSFLWSYWDVSNFIFVPLMIITFGDGLAEPIGIRFGKHKYKARALFTDKIYTRSYEGSLCVFLSGLFILSSLHEKFLLYEFLLNIFLIPIMVTLAEAFSPHALDNPIIIITCSTILSLTHLPQKI